ncbi:tyrosine-type recombinase/integrase [Novosphingobium aerophilum]|uniref:Integrase arm-type DNA-binding domain-containing protein n=1 Tax=Novosphingobium aerophilum TaxID=2839843 RepID=A0A7X1F8L7_9SPHN|nr:site-specific integrase [Novosphingobium aerophilum]MBC2652366.1 integrase arm-type DNA-binding domain-containing protein [Novosphingobium aerophilum]
MKVRFSKTSVDEAAPPAKGEVTIWDERIAGFGLKVTSAGSKVYFYRYRISRPGQASQTAPRKYTIGRHGSLTPDQARKRAQELAALVSQGVDPRQQELDAIADQDEADRQVQEQERARRDLAFGRLADLWLAHYESDMARRKSSVDMAKLVVNRYLRPALGTQPMPGIGRAELQPILDAIPLHKRGMRRAVFAYASVLWGWALRRGYVEANLLAAMEKPPAPAARERVLSDNELALVWQATETQPVVWGMFFRLLVLTGQRRSEVSDMRWEELDRKSAVWTIPPTRAKNGKAHLVPLSGAAVEQIDLAAGGRVWPKQGYVLTTTSRSAVSGISKAKAALDVAITGLNEGDAIPHWRLHDLRRTVATGLQRLGVRFEVTEAVLNHVSGAKGGVAGVYQRHDWAAEKRAALDAWAAHVGGLLIGVDQTNVVRMEARS